MADDRHPPHLPSDEGGTPSSRRRWPQNDRPRWKQWLPWLLLAAVVGVAFLVPRGETGDALNYSEFLSAVESGQVESVTIGPDGRVEGERSNGESFTTTIPTVGGSPDQLLQRLEDQGVSVDATAPSNGSWGLILVNLLPFLLIGAVIFWFMRRAQSSMGGTGGPFGMGQSKAREITDADRPETTFDDIAGYDTTKQEVREVVDFLRRPEEYRKIGARGPGGILLVGPPGTGKTMVARAVAGEAGVPFFASSGSEFVEMIVGVGASRVRDLFKKARQRAPAIIFIDELDSIGRKRGGGNNIGSHNEQEQTLNQILAEMDGFDNTEGVVVIAATNRAEMLDDALTRPGRFDRTVEVGLPTQPEREAILEIHTRSVATEDVDLSLVARATPGFSGADLRNLVNEGALIAVREGREAVTQADVDAARDRLILGQRLGSDVLRDKERQRVAVHESGHAVVGALTENSDPVTKVTILPSGRALGLTEQLPEEEKRLLARDEMEDQLAVMMGGRIAERLLTGQVSSGAAHDLSRATQLANRMVAEFGMSDQVGPVGYPSEDQRNALAPRPFAEDTQRDIDHEAGRILREAESTAEKLLTDNREGLEALVGRLLEVDTVAGEVVYDLLGVEPEAGARDADDVEGD